MKKLILSIFVALLASCSNNESTGVAPKGALGVEFGDHRDMVLDIMEQQGCKVISNSEVACSFEGGLFNFFDVKSSLVELNQQEKTVSIALFFSNVLDVNSIKETLISEYGDKFDVKKDKNNKDVYIWYWDKSDFYTSVSLATSKDDICVLFNRD